MGNPIWLITCSSISRHRSSYPGDAFAPSSLSGNRKAARSSSPFAFDQIIFGGHIAGRELRQEIFTQTHRCCCSVWQSPPYFPAPASGISENSCTFLLHCAYTAAGVVNCGRLGSSRVKPSWIATRISWASKIIAFKKTDIVCRNNRQNHVPQPVQPQHGDRSSSYPVHGADRVPESSDRENAFHRKQRTSTSARRRVKQTAAYVAHAPAGKQDQTF